MTNKQSIVQKSNRIDRKNRKYSYENSSKVNSSTQASTKAPSVGVSQQREDHLFNHRIQIQSPTKNKLQIRRTQSCDAIRNSQPKNSQNQKLEAWHINQNGNMTKYMQIRYKGILKQRALGSNAKELIKCAYKYNEKSTQSNFNHKQHILEVQQNLFHTTTSIPKKLFEFELGKQFEQEMQNISSLRFTHSLQLSTNHQKQNFGNERKVLSLKVQQIQQITKDNRRSLDENSFKQMISTYTIMPLIKILFKKFKLLGVLILMNFLKNNPQSNNGELTLGLNYTYRQWVVKNLIINRQNSYNAFNMNTKLNISKQKHNHAVQQGQQDNRMIIYRQEDRIKLFTEDNIPFSNNDYMAKLNKQFIQLSYLKNSRPINLGEYHKWSEKYQIGKQNLIIGLEKIKPNLNQIDYVESSTQQIQSERIEQDYINGQITNLNDQEQQESDNFDVNSVGTVSTRKSSSQFSDDQQNQNSHFLKISPDHLELFDIDFQRID